MLVRKAEDELLGIYPEQTPLPLHPRARFVIAYLMGDPVGCGALVPFDGDAAEIKRMYVLPAHRRCGVGRRILTALTRRAAGQGFVRVVLETGTRHPAAIAFYEAAGFERTPAYGPYVGNRFSVCLVKRL